MDTATTPPTLQPTSTGFISAVQVLHQLLRHHGLDPEAIATAAGLAPSDRTVPAQHVDELLKAALAHTHNPAFGLDAARCWHPSYFGVLGHAWLVSPTLLDGLTRVADYYTLVGQRGAVEVVPEDGGIKVRYWGHRGHPAAVETAAIAVDMVMSILLDMCRYNAGDTLRPRSASLRRSAPDTTRDYERFFGCPVRFGAEDNHFVLARADAEEALPIANRRLASTFDRMLADDLQRLHDDDIVARCRAALAHRLPSGRLGAPGIAKTLHLSPRTLQRRLASAGTNFRDVLDEVRRGLALQYADEPHRPLTEVAFLLGFRELSSFTRAFRRWTGCTPSAYRSRLSPA